METIHPVEGVFGSEFPSISNLCGVMMAYSRKTLKFFEECLWVFFERTTPYAETFKILFQKFTWRHWSTLLCSNVVKFVRQAIAEIVRYLVDKKKNKISPASQTVATVHCVQIAPRMCQGQPPTMYSECSRFHPNRFTAAGVIAKRVNTAKLRPKVIPIFASQHSFQANNEQYTVAVDSRQFWFSGC